MTPQNKQQAAQVAMEDVLDSYGLVATLAAFERIAGNSYVLAHMTEAKERGLGARDWSKLAITLGALAEAVRLKGAK